MNSIPLRLLLIDSDPQGERRLKEALYSPATPIEIERADSVEGALTQVENGPVDLVLLEASQTDSLAAALTRLRSAFPQVPLLLLTASAFNADLSVPSSDTLSVDELTEGVVDQLLARAHGQRHLRQETERLREEVQRSHNSLQEFAQVVSHDLKTPLWVIGYTCDLIHKNHREVLSEDALRFLEASQDAVKRMGQQLNDLLEYARVTSRGKPLKETDSDTALAQAVALLQVEIEKTGARISHDPLPLVNADAVQLAQIFQQILENALKYRREQAPEVHVSTTRQNGEWIFSIRDNGIGIEREYTGKIFGVFQRLHAEHEYSGTGIGLAICQRILERHGGRIWVESEPGEGSTFYFTLPAVEEQAVIA